MIRRAVFWVLGALLGLLLLAAPWSAGLSG